MRRPRSIAEIGVLLFLNGIAGLFLLMSSVLRETRSFWRNDGGYPVFLRGMVYYLHYPLLALVFGGTALGTLMSLRFFAGNRGQGGMKLLGVCALEWMLLGLVLGIMLLNNVQNLLNGRPLHYHPGDR